MILGFNPLCAVGLVRNEFSALSAYGVADILAQSWGVELHVVVRFEMFGEMRGRQRGADKRYGVDSNI